MKGGRLKIVNESRYPTDEVEALVRFALDEIDLTGDALVAVVKNTKKSPRRGRPSAYSGTAYSLTHSIPTTLYERYCGKRRRVDHLILMRVGPPETFPTSAFRHYAGVKKDTFRDWREGLVAVTAHEGMHAQHHHDGAYEERSGRRMVKVPSRALHSGRTRKTERYKIVKVRVGAERIEPRCEAFEAYMLNRYRQEHPQNPQEAVDYQPDWPRPPLIRGPKPREEVKPMARVVVQTDDGREVWSMDGIEAWHIEAGKLTGQMNIRASNLASGIVRAVQDAEKIQRGEDPRRPSEIAMARMHALETE